MPRTSRGFWKKLLISNSRGESQSLSFVSIINIEDLKYRFIDLGVFTISLSQYFPVLRFLLSYHDEFITIECENDQKTSLPFLESRRLGIKYALLSVYIGSGKTTGKRKLKHSLKKRCMRELWERDRSHRETPLTKCGYIAERTRVIIFLIDSQNTSIIHHKIEKVYMFS